MPQLIFGTVIVDGDANVVFLHKLFHARQNFRARVAGNNHADAGTFAVFEFRADVGIFIFSEINDSGGVELYAGGSIIGQRGGFLRRVHRGDDP